MEPPVCVTSKPTVQTLRKLVTRQGHFLWLQSENRLHVRGRAVSGEPTWARFSEHPLCAVARGNARRGDRRRCCVLVVVGGGGVARSRHRGEIEAPLQRRR